MPAKPAERAAEQYIESVIVTARKQPEQESVIPAWMATTTRQELAADRTYDYRSLVFETPSLFAIDVFSVVDTPISVRGVAGNGSREPSVGYFVDGVYQGGDPGMQSHDFVDVERIELLHGPQGALYGKSSTAGAINVITATPTDEREFEAIYDWNNNHRSRYSVVAAGALVPGIFRGRMAASLVDFDGVDLHRPTRRRRGSKDDAFVRAKLNWKPMESIDITPSFYARHVDQVPYPFRKVRGTSDFVGTQTDADLPGDLEFQAEGFAVRTEINLGHLDVDLVSGGNYSDHRFTGDLDDTAVPALLIARDSEKQDFSQEIRVGSDWPRGWWMVGAFYFTQKDDSRQFISDGVTRQFIFSDSVARRKANTYSLFSLANARLWRATQFELQTRIDYDLRTQKSPGGKRKATFTEPSARVSLSHFLTPATLAFISHAWAHRPGGFNDGALPRYGPEHTRTAEAGIKVALPAIAGNIQLGAHHSRISNQQITEIDPATAAQLIRNRGSARIYGIDLSSNFRFTKRLTATLSASWLHARYGDVVTPQLGPDGFGFQDISGNNLTNAPDYSVFAGLSYEVQLGALFGRFVQLKSRGDCRFTGEQAWDQLNTAISEATVICRASVTIDGGGTELRAYLENALDTDYHIGYLPGYQLPFSSGSDLAMIGLGRTLGVQLKASF